MKEITGKKSLPLNNLPKILKPESGSIYDQEQIPNKFNKFFANVGSDLASKIPDVDKSFNDYLTRNETNIDNLELSFEEFENAFKSVKRNKTSWIDNISSNIIIYLYLCYQFFQKYLKELTTEYTHFLMKITYFIKNNLAFGKTHQQNSNFTACN